MSVLSDSACLIGPVDPPPPVDAINHFPHIVAESVLPQPPVKPESGGVLTVHYCDSDSEIRVDQEFRVGTVIEYDVEQDLHVRWFVDYDATRADIHRFAFYEQVLPGDPGGPIERSLTSVLIAPAWLSVDTAAGAHEVEVVVADAPWAIPGSVVNQTPREPGLSDRYHWPLELVDDGACP